MPPRPDIKPIDEPRRFDLTELFFSTTDKRGVIRYGNEVFTRIAGYPLEEMQGEPHNLVRHPDMPRCAFRLVWDYLKQDRIVGAYVKNMASDGRHYWVFALILPTPDGYLSIRLKPSSGVFGVIQQAYQAVLQEEQRAKSGGANSKEIMDAGATKLMELLGSQGYTTYDEFLWATMTAEMESRGANLRDHPSGACSSNDAAEQQQDDQQRLVALLRGAVTVERRLGDVIARPETFSELRKQIIPKSEFIMAMGQAIRLQSVNAEAHAARLGERAKALAQVAENLSSQAGLGAETIAKLNQKLQQLVRPIAELVFNAMVSKVQIEMANAFVREILDGRHDASEHGRLIENLDLLFRTFLQTVRGVPEALGRLTGELGGVEKEVQELERFLHTLHFIYIAGMIETARDEKARSFEAIFEQINEMINRADGILNELLDSVKANREQIQSLSTINASHFDRLESLLAA